MSLSGVAPAALGAPAVGVLLRLSLACYLQVPLTAVLLVGAASTDPAVPTLALGAGDPTNTQAGFCAQVTAAPGVPASSSAPAAGVATTAVSIVVLSCVGSLSTGVPEPLQALLNALGSWPEAALTTNRTASPVAAGASPRPSPPPASLFSALLLSAAPAGSGSVSASSPIVGPPAPHPSPSPPSTATQQQLPGGAQPTAGASSNGNAGASSVAIIGGAAGGGALVLALLVLVGFWLVLREQRRRAGKPMQSSNASSDATKEGGDPDVSFVNRMHSVSVPPGGDAATAPTEKGLAAVAAFKVCLTGLRAVAFPVAPYFFFCSAGCSHGCSTRRAGGAG